MGSCYERDINCEKRGGYSRHYPDRPPCQLDSDGDDDDDVDDDDDDTAKPERPKP